MYTMFAILRLGSSQVGFKVLSMSSQQITIVVVTVRGKYVMS